MEKQSPPSDETVSFKEYPPSEIYTTSDPPPAYIKSRQSSVVQVARIAAYTLVAVSFILGAFILASSYVTASLSCQEYQPYPQEYIEDRLPRFQGLVAEPLETDETRHGHLQSADHHKDDDQKTEESKHEEKVKEEVKENDNDSQQESEEQNGQEDDQELKFKLPIHLDLDALTGALLEGNSKSKMNCVVEKQKSEEVLNKDQRELITFGLDLAALDPGLKHVTGERLAIVCESSREAPKETQMNHIVLPFPLPAFHGIQQRMMPPHPMPQQHPMVQHPGVQQILPRNPFLPFLRPNPYQNILPPRPRPQSMPRRNIEEIPILVLEENDAQLQNLIELPRHGHPQIQNLMEFNSNKPIPQIQQIQSIVELARGAPSLQNLIEIPEKTGPIMHPTVQQNRQLPPWARPQIQEPVVQIQPLPHVMRPPQTRPMQVQVEARPFHVESGAIQVEGRPIHDMRPNMQMEHHPMQMDHRPIQMEPRPIQMEPRPEMRRPEGRALPIPSDTVNPPPPPFDMQPEPSRPHFVQPRSIRSVDNVLHRRDKRERRCACDCAC